MTLPKNASDNVSTLFHLIKNRSLTSIQLRQLTKSSYPPARIKNLKDLGISIIPSSEKYVSRNGKVSHITRYLLATPIIEAKKIFKQLAA